MVNDDICWQKLTVIEIFCIRICLMAASPLRRDKRSTLHQVITSLFVAGHDFVDVDPHLAKQDSKSQEILPTVRGLFVTARTSLKSVFQCYHSPSLPPRVSLKNILRVQGKAGSILEHVERPCDLYSGFTTVCLSYPLIDWGKKHSKVPLAKNGRYTCSERLSWRSWCISSQPMGTAKYHQGNVRQIDRRSES